MAIAAVDGWYFLVFSVLLASLTWETNAAYSMRSLQQNNKSVAIFEWIKSKLV